MKYNYYKEKEKRLSQGVAFWTKGDLIDLAIELELLESLNDADLWSYLVSFDDLCEFFCFLLCGGWGHSRNISVIDEELQNNPQVKALFDYCDLHHLSE